MRPEQHSLHFYPWFELALSAAEGRNLCYVHHCSTTILRVKPTILRSREGQPATFDDFR